MQLFSEYLSYCEYLTLVVVVETVRFFVPLPSHMLGPLYSDIFQKSDSQYDQMASLQKKVMISSFQSTVCQMSSGVME